jgi:hypothetical protein
MTPRPTFKFFATCKERELVRFSNKSGTVWAIVGPHRNGRRMLLMLPLDGAPCCENIMGETDALRAPYDTMAVVSYGTGYTVGRDDAGDCEIGIGGKLIGSHGSLAITAEGDFVCCKNERAPRQTEYFDLGTGDVRGEPKSRRAVFARWELVLADADGGPPLRVLQIRAKETPIVVSPIFAFGNKAANLDSQ